MGKAVRLNTGLAPSDAVLQLCRIRGVGKTVCPSEVARLLAKEANQPDGTEWRGHMPQVHEAVDALVDRGEVTLSWKGVAMERRSGPYRIAGISDPTPDGKHTGPAA